MEVRILDDGKKGGVCYSDLASLSSDTSAAGAWKELRKAEVILNIPFYGKITFAQQKTKET